MIEPLPSMAAPTVLYTSTKSSQLLRSNVPMGLQSDFMFTATRHFVNLKQNKVVKNKLWEIIQNEAKVINIYHLCIFSLIMCYFLCSSFWIPRGLPSVMQNIFLWIRRIFLLNQFFICISFLLCCFLYSFTSPLYGYLYQCIPEHYQHPQGATQFLFKLIDSLISSSYMWRKSACILMVVIIHTKKAP